MSVSPVLSGPGSFVTGLGLNWYNRDLTAGTSGLPDPTAYVCYGGPKENFPPITEWMNFYGNFDLQQATSLVAYDTGPEQGAIWNAIVGVSQESLVDARLVLAAIMQESGGYVYINCSFNGVENCGIMQAYNGSVSYDPSNMQGSITQMVRDGVQGTLQGPGYVQWLSQNSETLYAGDNEGNPYQAARGYNSGVIDFGNLNDPKNATASYVSDIANRLRGWNGLGVGFRQC